MKKTILILLAASLCYGQTPAPGPKYYRLDFAVKELDGGKLQSTKSYSVIVSSAGPNGFMVRSGDKVPITNGSQTTYLDLGVNIDCKFNFENATDLGLQVTADISSVGNTDTTRTGAPVIGQTKWSSNVVVPLKKATTVFSSESPASKRTTQLELTATPLQ
jgi:hypothetical protein